MNKKARKKESQTLPKKAQPQGWNNNFTKKNNEFGSIRLTSGSRPPRRFKPFKRQENEQAISKETRPYTNYVPHSTNCEIANRESRSCPIPNEAESVRSSRECFEDEGRFLIDEFGDKFKEHAAKLLGKVTSLWKKKQLHDIVLSVGHHRIGAHKIVLAAGSEYFCELFTSEENDPDLDGEQFIYTLHGVNHEIVKLLLESMYTSKLNVTYDNIDELMNAALFLRIQSAVDSCTTFLLENLTTSTCLQTLSVAISFDMDQVTEQASQHVAVHFTDLSNTPGFLNLSEEPILAVIARDDLHIDSEIEVFQACMRWLEGDINSRLPYLVPIIQHVRLAMITPTDIVDYIECVPYIMRNSQCEAMVNEALHYHCLPHRQSVLQSPRTIPRARVRLNTLVTAGGQPRRVKDPVNIEVMYYDPDTEEWKQLTKLTKPRHHHAAVTLGGFLYVAGGRETTSSGHPLQTVHRFDPRTGVWMQVADMIDARESFQLAILNDNIYAVGGRVDEKTSLSAVERYDPYRDIWEAVHPLSDPRRCVAVAAHEGKLYAVGGSGNQKISSKVECFDPEANTWEIRRHLAVPRFFSLLMSYGEHMYLAGGASLSSTGALRCIANIDQYNPDTDTWKTISTMKTPRAEMAGCVLDGCFYLVGGYNWEEKVWLKSSEKYDMTTNSWSTVSDFPSALTGMSGSALFLYDPPT